MAPITPHVPAWKRLGLQLKNAPEIRADTEPIATKSQPEPASTPQSKRKQQHHSTEEPQAKKLKTFNTPTRNLKKRKSVTFTPDTKIEDGDSIKQLFSAWVDQQKAADPSFGAKRTSLVFQTPDPPQVAEQVEDTTLSESEKRVKRVKKPEKPKKSKAAAEAPVPVPVRLSPALSYLRQYQDSRDTWKFNKNHQNFIIKHIFDISKIPHEYNGPLHYYIRGLQGAVRTRLRDEALKVKVQDLEAGAAGFPATMSDREKKQQEYNASMAEYVANVTLRDAATARAQDGEPPMGYEEGISLGLSDVAMRDRVGKRMRAEWILAQLAQDPQALTTTDTTGGSSDGNGDSQKRMRMNDGSALKPARKRKQRTTADVEDDETSSSESSADELPSETESDSDEEGSTDSDPVMEVAQARAQVEEVDTSSSSSSSSSEGSDDDEEDEDED